MLIKHSLVKAEMEKVPIQMCIKTQTQNCGVYKMNIQNIHNGTLQPF